MNDLLLLSTLLDGPMHGYALKKQIALITGHTEMHNNLVYPLLKRFVANGWVSQRESSGERGQTRETYALTAKGRQEIRGKLTDFSPKSASSGEAFSLRVGLFGVLEPTTRSRILDERDKWLAQRIVRLTSLAAGVQLGEWGGEVVKFLLAQHVAEQKWISRLRKRVPGRPKSDFRSLAEPSKFPERGKHHA
jgi:DNA-binding PadR family transcriptional regulator